MGTRRVEKRWNPAIGRLDDGQRKDAVGLPNPAVGADAGEAVCVQPEVIVLLVVSSLGAWLGFRDGFTVSELEAE